MLVMDDIEPAQTELAVSIVIEPKEGWHTLLLRRPQALGTVKIRDSYQYLA